MNPMMRALTARLATSVPALGRVTAGLSGMNALKMGQGELVQSAPNGQSWDSLLHPGGGSRIADAFSQLPNNGANPPQSMTDALPQQSPMDRIKAAYDALAAQPSFNNPALAAGLMSKVQQPPMNLASHGVVNVPDRVPTMAQGGDEPQGQNPMSFFLRNALAQREAPGGEYLNPTVGAQAAASPFKGLFG